MSNIKSIISLGLGSVVTIAGAVSTITTLVRHNKVEKLSKEIDEIHTNIQELLNKHIDTFKSKLDTNENIGDVIRIINMKIEITNAYTSTYCGNGIDISFSRLIAFNKEMKETFENLAILKGDFEILYSVLNNVDEEKVSDPQAFISLILNNDYFILDKYLMV